MKSAISPLPYSNDMTVAPDHIASLVHQEFDKLPAKRKPVVRDNGLHEWVPLSGIVAEGNNGKLTYLSLATGMKCLPASKLSQAQGNVLHDWHAETLAIRAFNRFVLDECLALANGSKSSSEFLRWRDRDEMGTTTPPHDGDGADGVHWHGQPFTWREDVLLHMYCSEAPLASQSDATPWDLPIPEPQDTPASPASPAAPETILPGRAYFSKLGIIRRKPARPDAPPTLSKSCSDKLALHQVKSLLLSVTSLLVSPEYAYIHTLVIPGAQYSEVGCRRAFSAEFGDEGKEGEGMADGKGEGRMVELAGRKWEGGYGFRPFAVKTTGLEFRFSRRRTAETPVQDSALPSPSSSPPRPATTKKITPSPISTAQTPTQIETTQNGILRGQKSTVPSNPRGASFASRRQIWMAALGVLTSLDDGSEDDGVAEVAEIKRVLGSSIYGEIKDAELLAPRRRVKEEVRELALKGWVRNLGDEDFRLGS
ncbi:adenosine deaminase/editase [Xylaria sp. CBS 124048]|nr:adenosine deaminase/editase [Xylaria sp. CBS 124048]